MFLTDFNGTMSRSRKGTFTCFVHYFYKLFRKIFFNIVIFYTQVIQHFTFHHQICKLFSITSTTSYKKVTKWLHTNKLTSNTGKSNFMVFKRKKFPIDYSLNIYLDIAIINRKEKAKFLGVFVSESMS